jgi:hypothetical protein
LQETDHLSTQLIERRQGREGFDTRDVELLLAEARPDDLQLFVLVGIGDGDLGRGHWVPRKSDRGRSGEERLELLEFRADQRELGEPVLGHAEIGARRAHLPTQIGHLGDRHAGLMGDDDDRYVGEIGAQRIDQLLLMVPVHGTVSDR